MDVPVGKLETPYAIYLSGMRMRTRSTHRVAPLTLSGFSLQGLNNFWSSKKSPRHVSYFHKWFYQKQWLRNIS